MSFEGYPLQHETKSLKLFSFFFSILWAVSLKPITEEHQSFTLREKQFIVHALPIVQNSFSLYLHRYDRCNKDQNMKCQLCWVIDGRFHIQTSCSLHSPSNRRNRNWGKSWDFHHATVSFLLRKRIIEIPAVRTFPVNVVCSNLCFRVCFTSFADRLPHWNITVEMVLSQSLRRTI